jgi:hypothetical protein
MEKLFQGCTEQELNECRALLKPEVYVDVCEERASLDRCGHASCSNAQPLGGNVRRRKQLCRSKLLERLDKYRTSERKPLREFVARENGTVVPGLVSKRLVRCGQEDDDEKDDDDDEQLEKTVYKKKRWQAKSVQVDRQLVLRLAALCKCSERQAFAALQIAGGDFERARASLADDASEARNGHSGNGFDFDARADAAWFCSEQCFDAAKQFALSISRAPLSTRNRSSSSGKREAAAPTAASMSPSLVCDIVEDPLPQAGNDAAPKPREASSSSSSLILGGGDSDADFDGVELRLVKPSSSAALPTWHSVHMALTAMVSSATLDALEHGFDWLHEQQATAPADGGELTQQRELQRQPIRAQLATHLESLAPQLQLSPVAATMAARHLAELADTFAVRLGTPVSLSSMGWSLLTVAMLNAVAPHCKLLGEQLDAAHQPATFLSSIDAVDQYQYFIAPHFRRQTLE